jgi:hypothetical protein
MAETFNPNENIFEQVRRDAVREARAGDPREPSSGANYASSGLSASNAGDTFADEDGNTMQPFCADIDAVDDPHRFYL